MAQAEEKRLALQALTIMSPHLTQQLRRSLQENIDAGEPYESLIPLIGEAPKYDVKLPEDLVTATINIAEPDDKDYLMEAYAH